MRRLIFALVALVGSPVVHGAVLAAPGAMCGGMAATIVGTEGKDVIELTPGRDVVVALGGDDRVYNPRDTEKNESASDPQPVDAPENDDVVCLGDGDDFAKGAHRVDGGAGKDEIRRAEVVHAGPGDDSVINDGCRPAVVYLGAGNDRFVGFGSYDPSFEGPMGNSDYNQCRNANDEVHGGDGNDDLFGGDGDDRLFGEAGGDTLDGWMGKADRCEGGPGKNELRFCET